MPDNNLQTEGTQHEIPKITVTPPDDIEGEGTEEGDTEEGGTEEGVTQTGSTQSAGTQTAGTQTEKKPNPKVEKAKAAVCSVASVLAGKIGKDIGGNTGEEIAKGIAAAITSAITEDPTALANFAISLMAGPDPTQTLLAKIDKDVNKLLQNVQTLTDFEMSKTIDQYCRAIKDLSDLLPVSGKIDKTIVTIGATGSSTAYILTFNCQMIADCVNGRIQGFDENFWNTKVKGQTLTDAAKNFSAYFMKTNKAFLTATKLATIIDSIYPNANTISLVNNHYDSYINGLRNKFGTLVDLAGLIQGNPDYVPRFQLVSAVDNNLWVYADHLNSDTNVPLLLKRTEDMQYWSQTVFHNVDNKLMGRYDGATGFKEVWGRDNENWFTGGSGTYSYIEYEGTGRYRSREKITVTNDKVNLVRCYGIATINNTSVFKDKKAIMVAISNPRGKFMDNFKSQGWIRTSDGTFGNDGPVPQNLWLVVL